MAADSATIEVCADWEGLGGPHLVGELRVATTRGKQVFSFEYAREWLGTGAATALDPDLQYVRGVQYAPTERANFGVILDSSPDRWGRLLMQRREALMAREARRPERRLADLDFVLGVYDGHRLGALRFRLPGGPFLDDNAELASPPWTSLRELEQASLHLEREGAERDPAYGPWLRMLVAPGRSLGGARPKASVLDQRGNLWLAKFPSERDVTDIGGWESVVHALAQRAGITVAEAKRQKFAHRHHTFLSRRFDRTGSGSRIHFASAMTLLQRSDGDSASYLDLAAVLARHGAHAARDLEQLWRRIVFFAAVSNVDDHLRNHGFLMEPKGWTLAPAYDMNPVALGNGLALNISATDNAQDLELITDVAPSFRVKSKRAKDIIGEVMRAVRSWRDEAKRARISRSEQDQMASAFKLADA